jgi:hypothetical protein
MKRTIQLLTCLAFFVPAIVLAHPGNTDSVGCHTCKTNCAKWGLSYGEYHCHRSKGVEQPKEPVKSSATGITVPAPEYKQPVVKKATPTTSKENKEQKATGVATSTTLKVKSEVTVPQKSFLQTVFGLFR